MPTLARILAAIYEIAGKVEAALGKQGAMIRDVASDVLNLTERIVAAVYVPLDASLHAAINALRDEVIGTPTTPPTTLGGVGTTVTNVYNTVTGTSDQLGEFLPMLQSLWWNAALARGASMVIPAGGPGEISVSGYYELAGADGLSVDVVSVPASVGCELAGVYRRYPHIGWCVPERQPDDVYGDLSYFGPERQGFAFAGLRQATGVWIFIRPGVVLSVAGWKIVQAQD